VILRVAQQTGACHTVLQHQALARIVGISEQRIEAARQQLLPHCSRRAEIGPD
jgi:hypothetical protein